MSSEKIRLARNLAIAFTGGLLTLSWPASAQYPLLQSPATPNPYNWNTFHSGGVDDPAGGATGGTIYPLSLNSQSGNLLGTPTGIVPVTGPTGTLYDINTMFPSFLLGNVDGNNPLDPDLAATTPTANILPSRWYNFHQSDTGGNYIYEWFAPFVYQSGALGSENIITSDDSNATFFTTLSGTWNQTTSGSAVDGEYKYVTAPTAVTATVSNEVQWTINYAQAGLYYVSAHIPAVASGISLSKDAHYTLTYMVNGATVTQTTSVRAIQATGSITLLGPIDLAANQSVVITLDDSTARAYTTAPQIVADAVSLVPTTTTQTIDDTAATYTPAGGWAALTTTTGGDAGTQSIAYTATNQNYHRILAVAGAPQAATATAQWTFTIPSTGFYQASFHIPDAEQGVSAGSTEEYRVTDAHYVIQRQFGTTTLIEADTRSSQTDANSDQPIGTSFYATTGDTIAVSLDNSSNTIQSSLASQTYVVADSMTLTPSNGADAEGSAVAVIGDPGTGNPGGTDDPRAYDATNDPNGTKNPNAYPEIADAFYYGPLPGTVSDIDTTPHGYTAIGGAAPVDSAHKIRTLVYFGRRETGVNSSGGTFSKGTIYCVDGMTGSVVWMFDTPQLDHASGNATTWQDGDTGVLSTPVVARFNVCTGINGSGGKIFATKLCVVVADNDGRVYCLDAIGNRDGLGLSPNNTDATHNHDGYTINYNNNGNLVGSGNSGVTPTTGGLVGTTTAYWIFRPDPTRPKYLYGPNQWSIKPAAQYDPNSDMPVPGAFSTASPTIYIDTTKNVDLTTTQPGKPGTTNLGENAVIYIGNSNGVLYALDATGGVFADTDPAAITTGSGANVDKYYKTLPLLIKDPTDATGNTTLTDRVMTTNCRWWYSLRGPVSSPLNDSTSLVARSVVRSHFTRTTRAQGNVQVRIKENIAATSARAKAQAARKAAQSGKAKPKAAAVAKRSQATKSHAVAVKPAADTTSTLSNADIESAPAIYVNPADPTEVTVIFGSAHEQESTSNVGRIYAINDSIAGAVGWTGPIGNSGQGDKSGASPAALGPGYLDYNIDQIETWAFPQLHSQDASGNWQTDPRDALGNITGSPVVFFNSQGGGPNHGTFIYFAADSGPEIEPGNPAPAVRPSEGTTGRIWCINPTRQTDPTTQMKWAYPAAINPNIKVGSGASVEEVAEPSNPIGAFLRATPAVGAVSYPQHIQYVSAGAATEWQHADYSNASITGGATPVTVPMLYVGCAGSNDNGFYAIDLNGTITGATGTAADDASHFIYRVGSPNAANFQSSVALIVNSYSNTTPYTGPGGMVYGSAGGSLFQFSATPLSNGNNADGTATQAFPQVTVDSFNGFGPVSSASLAGMDVSDIQAPNAPATYRVEDWLFAGDTSSGFMHAITPRPNAAVGYGTDVGGYLSDVPPGVAPTQQFTLREPLHIHISDNVGTRLANLKNITVSENPVGHQPLPMFEWGNTAYIRITNVVPPNPGDADAARRIVNLDTADDLPTGYYLTNGSPISFQISDYDFDGNFSGTNDGGVINNVWDTTGNTGNLPDLNYNGFSTRSDTSAVDVLTDATTSGYFAAFPYALGDGTGRMNTPGARRKVINARQTAEIHAGDGTSGVNNGSGSLVGTVTLESTYIVTGSTAIKQPTFGILNPIAEIGGGVPLDQSSGVIAGDSFIGPWLNTASSAVPNSPWGTAAVANYGTLNIHNLALTNGNTYIGTALPGTPTESQLPANGDDGVVSSGADPTAPPAGTGGSTVTQPTGYQSVFTATGLINHNGSGDNGNGSNWGLRLYDRSNLYAGGHQISVSMERSALHWYDKTLYTGPGSVVNGLPWDVMPVSWNAGTNTSTDYPDIRRGNISYTMDPTGLSADIGNTQGGVQITQTNTVAPQQFANLPVQVGVTVPQYQPANLSLLTMTALAPQPGISNATSRYPDGYHTRVRVYVDTNRNGRWDTGEAYRDVDLQSGVPVDMGTSLVESTADVGAEAHGFGVQTDGYSPLSVFTPFNSAYSTSFVPLTVHNDGNVNLYNVLFNQRLQKQDYQGNVTSDTLRMQSDSTDNLSTIPAYDMLGITGADSLSNASKNFLIRTSLDADLLSAYANTAPSGSPFGANVGVRNPGFAGAGFTAAPGYTFHKARVGDTGPPTMTVPDVPHDNASFLGSTYYVANPAKPEVGVAIPFGTPAGSYSQLIRVLEGIDPINSAGGTGYSPLLPPTYGTNRKWLDVWQASAGDYFRPIQPTSTSGTTVKVRVTESRITNGANFGTLPLLPNPVPIAGSANYMPVAFRDAYWNINSMVGSGGLAMYYTGIVSGTAGTNEYGYWTPFVNTGYFPNTATSWGLPIANSNGTLFTLPATANTSYGNLSIVRPTELYNRQADGFFVNTTTSGTPTATYAFYTVTTGGNGAPYSTTLECAPVTAGAGTVGVSSSIGQLGTPIPVVTGAAAIYHPRGVMWGGVPWVFWHAGGKGGTRIYYSYETTTAGGAVQFTPPAVLPVPASVSQVMDPSPFVGQQFMEVSYSAVDPAGHGNIYVSRYKTYLPTTTTSANMLLALDQPAPINEYLQPDTANNWWYARDTGWLRPTATTGTLDVLVNVGGLYKSFLTGSTTAPQFDPGSGLLVYSNVVNPLGGNNVTIYMDLAGGRIRFYPKLASDASVYATFQPQARKITTDQSRSSVDPISFIDDSFKSNGVGNQVQTSRYWFIFRKASPSGVSKSPTVYYKTQRLMLAVTDGNGKPISFPVDSKGMPQITVVAQTSTGPVTLFDGGNGGGCVDVDWQRGRVYLPQVWYDPNDATKSVSTEGLLVKVAPIDTTLGWSLTDTVRWMDELTGSDPTAPGGSISGDASTNEREVPIFNAVNEGEVSAFLDPFAYANCLNHVYSVPGINTSQQEVPHNIWLFWSSTRNGASDIYSMPINPNFAVGTQQ